MLTLELQSDTGESGDNVTTEAVIGGTVTNGDASNGINVDIDVDGDGAADGCVPVGEGGEFAVDLGASLPHGERTVQARVRQWDEAIRDYVFGSWESVAFTYEPADSINESTVDEDAILAGTPDGDGPDALTDPVGDAEGETEAADPDLDPVSEEPDLNIPFIVNFDASSEIPDIWFFEGAVDYDRPTKLTIEFGGLLAGHSADVDSEGTFRLSLELSVNDMESVITAQAIGGSTDIPNSDIFSRPIG